MAGKRSYNRDARGRFASVGGGGGGGGGKKAGGSKPAPKAAKAKPVAKTAKASKASKAAKNTTTSNPAQIRQSQLTSRAQRAFQNLKSAKNTFKSYSSQPFWQRGLGDQRPYQKALRSEFTAKAALKVYSGNIRPTVSDSRVRNTSRARPSRATGAVGYKPLAVRISVSRQVKPASKTKPAPKAKAPAKAATPKAPPKTTTARGRARQAETKARQAVKAGGGTRATRSLMVAQKARDYYRATNTGTKRSPVRAGRATRSGALAMRPTGAMTRQQGAPATRTQPQQAKTSARDRPGSMTSTLRGLLSNLAKTDAARIREIEQLTGAPIKRPRASTAPRVTGSGSAAPAGRGSVAQALRSGLRGLAQSDARFLREVQAMTGPTVSKSLAGKGGKGKGSLPASKPRKPRKPKA